MAPPNHESTVQNFLARGGYRNAGQAKRDIMSALNNYRGLTPKLEKFTFNDGRARDLICLRGTIPVTYRGSTYNIPVGFWILVRSLTVIHFKFHNRCLPLNYSLGNRLKEIRDLLRKALTVVF